MMCANAEKLATLLRELLSAEDIFRQTKTRTAGARITAGARGAYKTLTSGERNSILTGEVG
jgi:hypothetical protein